MRIQYEITKEKNIDIEKMMEETQIQTKRELINNAITLFEWAIKERKNGKIIVSLDEKKSKFKELLMPSLSNV